MSLVGPRSIVPAENDKHPDYGTLFMFVKPTFTGNYQVDDRSVVSDYSHHATLDIEYIRDQSLKTDLDNRSQDDTCSTVTQGAHLATGAFPLTLSRGSAEKERLAGTRPATRPARAPGLA